MRLALATCADFPAGDEDAALLDAAVARAGHTGSWLVWDDSDVDWASYDVVVLRSTWDYTPRLREFLGWLTTTATLTSLVNPYAPVAWSTDKIYLRDLDAADVPTVPSRFVGPGEELDLSGVTGEIVVKPSVAAGSRGAGRFDLGHGEQAAREHVASLHAEGRTAVVQPYLAEVDVAGETAVVCLGGQISHAARKAPLLSPGTVRALHAAADTDGHGLFVQETMTAAEPSPAERAVAEQALAYLADRFERAPAYARVDLLPTPDGPVVAELELVEPSLFLAYAPDPDAAADRLVAALAAAGAA